MAEIFDARAECVFEGKNILFDTNVWISIYGNDPTGERAVYSDFYRSAIKNKNSIVTNSLIISELFNRMCKIEYELLFGKEEYHLLKERRKSDADYVERVESVRDTCLNVLDDCSFLCREVNAASLGGHLEAAAKGNLDLTDAALVECCISKDLIFVTHDKDFEGIDFKLVTANRGILKRAGL